MFCTNSFYCPTCKTFRRAHRVLGTDKLCVVCGANFTELALLHATEIQTRDTRKGTRKCIVISDDLPEQDKDRALNLALRMMTSN